MSDYDVCSLTIFADNNVKFVDNIGCRLEAITFSTSWQFAYQKLGGSQYQKANDRMYI